MMFLVLNWMCSVSMDVALGGWEGMDATNDGTTDRMMCNSVKVSRK